VLTFFISSLTAGYKLGTFCVEGPVPRPEGLTEREQEKLKEYAAKAMQLMVERRKVLRDRLDNNVVSGEMQRHAAVANNLGAILYSDYGDCANAMRLFQESVQTLMYVEGESQGGAPSEERQAIMSQLLILLSAEYGTPESRQALVRNVTLLYPVLTNNGDPPVKANNCCELKVINAIPALFYPVSKLKGVHCMDPLPCLVFGEPFKIDLDAPITAPNSDRLGECPFVIPVNQCSKATLFNMGLIHYLWGTPDTAVQFFELAASLSAKSTPLTFDPVVLGCLNNMAQIHLQYRRPNDATEMLEDALTRGNAALATMYSDPDRSPSSAVEEEEMGRTHRLRRKLARTVMNLGHVHFFNCDYEASMATCMDALRLMHTNMDEPEVAAVWYNVSLLNYHQGNKVEALEKINKFINMASQLKGVNQVQLADALYRKGLIRFEMGQLYECMWPLNESLRIRKRDDNHVAVAESLCLIGKVLQVREEYDFALNALTQALDIQRKISADEKLSSFEVAQTLLEVGRAFHSKGELDESLKVYLEVADLTRNFFGDRHPFVARIDIIIGNLYLENGKIDEGLAAFSEAMKIRMEQGLPVDVNPVHDKLAGIKMEFNPVAPMA
jgi:tetratricopeptide (TPR) repeat protein